MIYTRFGSPVEIVSVEYNTEYNVLWVDAMRQDGSKLHGIAVYEFRADGGLEEINKAIADLYKPVP